jgi:dynein heavy chain
VLKKNTSSYLTQFEDLKDKIQVGYDEASNTLKFLQTLEEPCRKIEKAQPKDIPKLLPDVLYNVRVIWELSKYYNTKDRMKGLLTRISNQINQRCRQKISKDEMLGDDVEKCMEDLDESIQCCQQWKEICTRHQYMIKTYSSTREKNPWELDKDDTIFAENEAFIQRCRDLKEICEGQL